MADKKDKEDTPQKIKERLLEVKARNEKEELRRRCYSAAMGRKWELPAEAFVDMSRGPKKWTLPMRNYVYKTAEDNGGVKTLVEMALDALDRAYEHAGDACRPEERGGKMPTAYEQNNCLCVVRGPRGEKRKKC